MSESSRILSSGSDSSEDDDDIKTIAPVKKCFKKKLPERLSERYSVSDSEDTESDTSYSDSSANISNGTHNLNNLSKPVQSSIYCTCSSSDTKNITHRIKQQIDSDENDSSCNYSSSNTTNITQEAETQTKSDQSESSYDCSSSSTIKLTQLAEKKFKSGRYGSSWDSSSSSSTKAVQPAETQTKSDQSDSSYDYSSSSTIKLTQLAENKFKSNQSNSSCNCSSSSSTKVVQRPKIQSKYDQSASSTDSSSSSTNTKIVYRAKKRNKANDNDIYCVCSRSNITKGAHKISPPTSDQSNTTFICPNTKTRKETVHQQRVKTKAISPVCNSIRNRHKEAMHKEFNENQTLVDRSIQTNIPELKITKKQLKRKSSSSPEYNPFKNAKRDQSSQVNSFNEIEHNCFPEPNCTYKMLANRTRKQMKLDEATQINSIAEIQTDLLNVIQQNIWKLTRRNHCYAYINNTNKMPRHEESTTISPQEEDQLFSPNSGSSHFNCKCSLHEVGENLMLDKSTQLNWMTQESSTSYSNSNFGECTGVKRNETNVNSICDKFTQINEIPSDEEEESDSSDNFFLGNCKINFTCESQNEDTSSDTNRRCYVPDSTEETFFNLGKRKYPFCAEENAKTKRGMIDKATQIETIRKKKSLKIRAYKNVVSSHVDNSTQTEEQFDDEPVKKCSMDRDRDSDAKEREFEEKVEKLYGLWRDSGLAWLRTKAQNNESIRTIETGKNRVEFLNKLYDKLSQKGFMQDTPEKLLENAPDGEQTKSEKLRTQWRNMSQVQKLLYYWQTLTNKRISESPFENFLTEHLKEHHKDERPTKSLIGHTLDEWNKFTSRQRKPYIYEALIARISSEKVNIFDKASVFKAIEELEKL